MDACGFFLDATEGQVHITSARGADILAYIEIDSGPYLVLPLDKVFDSGEQPVNVHPSNLVWLSAGDLNWVNGIPGAPPETGPRIAMVWGSMGRNQPRGHLVLLPAGFSGELRSEGPSVRVVVIRGPVALQLEEPSPAKSLVEGSYFSSTGPRIHRLEVTTEKSVMLYVRADGPIEIGGASVVQPVQ